MTEQQAINCVRDQFTGEKGFVAKLQGGLGLDRDGVAAVQVALDVLEACWADRAQVPKAAVLPMVDISTPMRENARRYPAMELEIMRLAGELADRVAEIFAARATGMSEQEAAALVYAHLTGVSGLALSLHHREHPQEEVLEELQTAFTTLERAWQHRDSVPKIIIGPMLDVRELIRGHAGLFPREQAQLEAMADELAEQVRRCLR